jgi:transcription elongation factor Elf1
MKLFMKSHYEKEAREMKSPLENEYVCVSCAGKLGGKVDRWLKSKWAFAKCDVCGNKCEVANPKEYIWR